MSVLMDSLVLVEGSGYFIWHSSPIPGTGPFSLEVDSPLPSGFAATLSGSTISILGTVPVGLTGNWPIAFKTTDSLAAVLRFILPMSFLPAQEAVRAIVDGPSAAQGSFYYALCGGPLCLESTYGQ